jgi:carboxypeptidase-like protein/TonB-dependent receptor-like protein
MFNKFLAVFKITFIIFLMIHINIFANPTGSIKGKLVDAETQSPLIGANVIVTDFALGAATDHKGFFILNSVPSGAYSVQFSYIGYQQKIKTDVIVKPGRSVFIEESLKPQMLETDAIVVKAAYFSEDEDQPVSNTNFSAEEIRRAPGSAGDVSRIIMGLPSIAKVNDQSNSLIVRGGSPIENAFYIDNIEIPNINHFPTQGSSGGPIGLINVDFIKDVNFYSGGFSTTYGDKLSSIMEMTFREGNRDAFDAQLDLNFSGFGGVAEGPLFGEYGSWLFSVRRSYLDYLIKAVDVGSSVAPSYGDIQGKLVYDLNSANKLTMIGIFADDHMTTDQKVAFENDMLNYGNQDIYEGTFGLNLRTLWEKIGYSNTSLSFTGTKFEEDFFETGNKQQLVKNRSTENTYSFRNTNHIRLNKANKLDFGVEAKYLDFNYNNYYSETQDILGNINPVLIFDKQLQSVKLGSFLSYTFQPFSNLTSVLGIRADYFDYNDNFHLSPRFSLSYKISDKTSLSASTGIFYQNLPPILLLQQQEYKILNDPYSMHYIIGLSHLLADDTKLSLEIYQKDYFDFPLDSNQPELFILDEVYYQYSFYQSHSSLNDNGKAFSHGIELMVQKKLATDYYGKASASYFTTKYKILDGKWKNRIFDNRFTMSIEGGYKPNSNWEFSLRWIYAGGTPYTPFDKNLSPAQNSGIFDSQKINEERYPDYHSLNIRFDRRFHFTNSNIIFYLSVWNAYNQKNIASYFWNELENKQDTTYQWGLLPIFGIEYEF